MSSRVKCTCIIIWIEYKPINNTCSVQDDVAGADKEHMKIACLIILSSPYLSLTC